MANRTCSEDGCERPHYGRGYCMNHYKKWRRRIGLDLVSQKTSRQRDLPCGAEGCEKPAQAKGLCNTHYQRQRKYGDPSVVHRAAYRGGFTKHGYRYLTVNRRQVLVHRMVMETMLGRKLRRHEIIHHKNGQRADNSKTNLELRTTTHPSGQGVDEMLAWCDEYIKTYRPVQRRIRQAQAEAQIGIEQLTLP